MLRKLELSCLLVEVEPLLALDIEATPDLAGGSLQASCHVADKSPKNDYRAVTDAEIKGKVAPRAGLEPSTVRLTVGCSTN
jgi:hypothetical protein